jgi:hypothetical protein
VTVDRHCVLNPADYGRVFSHSSLAGCQYNAAKFGLIGPAGLHESWLLGRGYIGIIAFPILRPDRVFVR